MASRIEADYWRKMYDGVRESVEKTDRVWIGADFAKNSAPFPFQKFIQKSQKEKIMLYEVAIVKSAKGEETEELILPPTPLLADSVEAANTAAVLKAVKEIGGTEPSRLKVLVRPFKA